MVLFVRSARTGARPAGRGLHISRPRRFPECWATRASAARHARFRFGHLATGDPCYGCLAVCNMCSHPCDSAVASSSYLGNVLGWQLIISHPFCLDLSLFNMFSSSVQNNTQTSHKLEADDSREGSQSDQEALQQLAASVYPDLVQHLCAARDLEKAPKHKRLPRSCSTSTCCERFREVLKA